MSVTSSTFSNQYLSATPLDRNDSLKLFVLEILEPFPGFFLFPILDLTAQILVIRDPFAILMPEESWLSGLLLAIGYKEITTPEGLGFIIAPEDLRHPTFYGSRDYFAFTSLQERFYFGLSTSEWVSTKDQRLYTPFKISNLPRKRSYFDEVINSRRSSMEFASEDLLSKVHIDSILKDCYYINERGLLPIATAGGFQHFEIYFSTAGLEDISEGVYKIRPQSPHWKQIQKTHQNRPIWESAFSQEYIQDCSNYLIIVLDLTEISEKYGSRSHRFSYMGLGGLLDRMHLSSTSYNLNFRIIGGFDEGLLKAILSIHDDRFIIGAIVALGSCYL